jgi:hypothetical protein
VVLVTIKAAIEKIVTQKPGVSPKTAIKLPKRLVILNSALEIPY